MKSSKETYYKIVENLDLIQDYKENLQKESLYLSYIEYDNQTTNKVLNTQKKIENLKVSIKDLILKTQELILTSCTKSELSLIRTSQDVKDFKNRLYNFKEFLIQSNNYTFFNNYYCQMMEELDVKRELIKKYGVINAFENIQENLSLIETRQEKLNLFQVAINKLKEVFKINQKEKNISTEETKNK